MFSAGLDPWRHGPDWRNALLMRMSDLKRWTGMATAMLALPLCACITHTTQESAALPQPWPQPPPNLTAYGAPAPDYPSVGGDILKGSSPSDLAAARAAAFHPLDEPDTPAPATAPSKSAPRDTPPPHRLANDDDAH